MYINPVGDGLCPAVPAVPLQLILQNSDKVCTLDVNAPAEVLSGCEARLSG